MESTLREYNSRRKLIRSPVTRVRPTRQTLDSINACGRLDTRGIKQNSLKLVIILKPIYTYRQTDRQTYRHLLIAMLHPSTVGELTTVEDSAVMNTLCFSQIKNNIGWKEFRKCHVMSLSLPGLSAAASASADCSFDIPFFIVAVDAASATVSQPATDANETQQIQRIWESNQRVQRQPRRHLANALWC